MVFAAHFGAVQSAVATSPISATDEEEAMALLMEVYALLRRQRSWETGGGRCASSSAAVEDGVGTTAAGDPTRPLVDVRRPPGGPVGPVDSSDAPPYRGPLPQPVLRWKRGVLSADPAGEPPAQ